MKLTHIDEMPCLEGDEVIYLTDEQYAKLSELNSEQTKAYLIRDVKPRLTAKEQIILQRWLSDPTTSWNLEIE